MMSQLYFGNLSHYYAENLYQEEALLSPAFIKKIRDILGSNGYRPAGFSKQNDGSYASIIKDSMKVKLTGTEERPKCTIIKMNAAGNSFPFNFEDPKEIVDELKSMEKEREDKRSDLHHIIMGNLR
jgi:hypothetical protein